MRCVRIHWWLGGLYREFVRRNVDVPYLKLYINTLSEELELCSERAYDPKVLQALENLFTRIDRAVSDDEAIDIFARYGRKVARLAGIRCPRLVFGSYDYLEVMYVPSKPREIDEARFVEVDV